MKQLFTILSAMVIMVACKPKAETDQTKVLSAVDSAEFAAFQEWKEQQEAKKNAETKTVYVVQKQATSTSNNTTTRKKWSNATKGAVIGGVGGAIVGGVVSKRNRAAGAVIGGIVGGGAGYGIGKTYDNKQNNQ